MTYNNSYEDSEIFVEKRMATDCNGEQCIVSCSCNSDKGWYYHTIVDQPVGQSMTLDPSTLNESANITYSTRATTADDYYITATSKRAYADLGTSAKPKRLSCKKTVDCAYYGYVSSCSTGTVGTQVTVQTDGAALTCYKD